VNAHRIELLLTAQMSLRKHERENRHHLFEIERAIDEITGGCSNSHTDCVERWVQILLSETGAAA
jgi:hypothetical protein